MLKLVGGWGSGVGAQVLTPCPPLPSGEGELTTSPLSGTERGTGGEDSTERGSGVTSPREVPVVCLDLLRRGGPVEDENAVAECGGRPRCEPEVQLFLPVGERLPAQRVGGEQSVAAGVPKRREADVVWMIQDGERDRLAGHDARQHCPAAARAPHRVADEALRAPVSAGDTVVVEHGDGGRVPAGVREDLGCRRRLLERARHPQAEEAVLLVGERHGLAERRKCRDPVDGAQAVRGAEYKPGV